MKEPGDQSPMECVSNGTSYVLTMCEPCNGRHRLKSGIPVVKEQTKITPRLIYN